MTMRLLLSAVGKFEICTKRHGADGVHCRWGYYSTLSYRVAKGPVMVAERFAATVEGARVDHARLCERAMIYGGHLERSYERRICKDGEGVGISYDGRHALLETA